MQIAQTYSYRHADAILQSAYSSEKAEILAAIAATNWSLYPKPKVRKRKGKVVATMTIDQVKTNKLINKAFAGYGWTSQPLIVGTGSKLKADFRKGKIQVEVQLGNMARWYTDVFKFLVSYSADDIELGVLVVPMQTIADDIDENVVYYERVLRELPHAKMGITIPIYVIGLGP